MGEMDLNVVTKQANVLWEYSINAQSDADFPLTSPAFVTSNAILAQLAPKFGFNPADLTNYNFNYKMPVFAHMSAERLYDIYTNEGLDGVELEVSKVFGAKRGEQRGEAQEAADEDENEDADDRRERKR